MPVLELVGLRERAKDRVKTYSLGMKQRLAVASALLKNPELLILDEPANGLDPGGIREMRTLMRTLSESGMTVLLSSHILGEIQLICDSVTIISAGRRVARRARSPTCWPSTPPPGQGRGSRPGVDLRAAAEVLRAAGAQVTRRTRPLLVANAPNPAQITRVLAERQIYVSELTPVGADLESVFLELTGTAPVDGQNRQVDQSAWRRRPAGWGNEPVHRRDAGAWSSGGSPSILRDRRGGRAGRDRGRHVLHQREDRPGPGRRRQGRRPTPNSSADAQVGRLSRSSCARRPRARRTRRSSRRTATRSRRRPGTLQTRVVPAGHLRSCATNFGAMVTTLAALLALAAFVVGASFVGRRVEQRRDDEPAAVAAATAPGARHQALRAAWSSLTAYAW